MNKSVLVQIVAPKRDSPAIYSSLVKYGFELIITDPVEISVNGQYFETFMGRLDSETVTLIKLKEPLISSHMVVSYIPDKEKDKHRS